MFHFVNMFETLFPTLDIIIADCLETFPPNMIRQVDNLAHSQPQVRVSTGQSVGGAGGCVGGEVRGGLAVTS